VEQGEPVPGFDIVPKLFLFLRGQGSFLVPLGQLVHPSLILFIEPKGQDIVGQVG
jgi:hypothetical protein